MVRLVKKRSKKLGLPPGSLVYVGEQPDFSAEISVFHYTWEILEEHPVADLDTLAHLIQQPGIFWVNINGVHDTSLIDGIGRLFEIDPLTLEDIVTTTQRPKFSDDGSHLFIVTREISFDHQHRVIENEQVSLVVGTNFLLSFQERPGDVFDIVRERLRNSRGRIRHLGSDYLAYALIDVIVDHYFLVLEEIGEQTELLEEEILTDATEDLQERLTQLRRELVLIRRAVYPIRENLHAFWRSESPLIAPATQPYLKDAHEHAIQIAETLDALRELLTSLMEQYMSGLSRRLNEVMKLLTIISSIFIPLTFIAGVYGMNFLYMPELTSRYAYPIVLLVMLSIGLTLAYLFKRRGWF